MPPTGGKTKLCRLSDDEAAVRCSLRVVFQHQIAWNTIWLYGSSACQRSHDHPMFQAGWAKLNWAE